MEAKAYQSYQGAWRHNSSLPLSSVPSGAASETLARPSYTTGTDLPRGFSCCISPLSESTLENLHSHPIFLEMIQKGTAHGANRENPPRLPWPPPLPLLVLHCTEHPLIISWLVIHVVYFLSPSHSPHTSAQALRQAFDAHVIRVVPRTVPDTEQAPHSYLWEEWMDALGGGDNGGIGTLSDKNRECGQLHSHVPEMAKLNFP